MMYEVHDWWYYYNLPKNSVVKDGAVASSSQSLSGFHRDEHLTPSSTLQGRSIAIYFHKPQV